MTKSAHSLKQAILIIDKKHDTSPCFSYELDNRNVGAHGIPGDGLECQKDFRNNEERSIGEDGPYIGSIMLSGNRFEECDLGIAFSHTRAQCDLKRQRLRERGDALHSETGR
jgi:hypothetical protein